MEALLDKHRESRSENARGFVLVGVIMMVLALTILGLSLFSLSSYEAQFMNRSLDETQAQEYAMGGLARARFALAVPPDSLIQVKRNLPYEYVTYAVASQNKAGVTDTSGLILFGGDEIRVKVTATYRNVTRTVEASYLSSYPENYYKRLMTLNQGVEIHTPSGVPPTSRKFTTFLQGRLWLGNGDSTTTLVPNVGSYTLGIRPQPPPPVPAVGAFIAANASGASSVGYAPLQNEYRLWSASNGKIDFWTVPPVLQDITGLYTLQNVLPLPRISVRGRAVLLLPKGVRFVSAVTIARNSSDPDACLIVVAQKGQAILGDPVPDPAIWFFNSIATSEIPVILVSDATVLLESFNGGGNSTVDNLSVFAKNAFVTGPITGSGFAMTLKYQPLTMDAQIDTLMAHAALPNFTNVNGALFTLRPGTWRISN